MQMQGVHSVAPLKVAECLALLGSWRAGDGALFRRLAAALREATAAGRLLPNAVLPAERPMASALGVSRTTVIAAYEALRDEGLIESRRGSGWRVLASRPSDAGNPAAAGLWASGLATTGLLATGLAAGGPATSGLAAGGPVTSGGPGLSAPRSLFYRGLVEAGGGTIDLLAAHLPAHPLVEQEAPAAAADLVPLLSHHGYWGLGIPALRQAVAAYLTAGGLPTVADQVLITTGAHQAIGLAAALYLQPGDAVAIEDPTYPGAIDIFAQARARLLSVPVTADGAGVDRLAEIVAREAPRLIYVIPSFQNPTGALMPEPRRRALARLAAETGTVVVEDLTFADLDHGTPPPPPVAALLPGAPILAVGSLDKLVWGGLRTGWIRAEAPVISRLARHKILADLGSPLAGQVLAARLLPHAGVIRAARRRLLRECLAALESALLAHLPDWTWSRPPGGLCLWARLPRGNALELARLAAGHGVAIVPGPTCSPRDAWESHVRLPFVHDPATLREGIVRLARAWRAYAPAAAAPPSIDVLV
jgi:DNA-binding transcriptional MocR family regulator